MAVIITAIVYFVAVFAFAFAMGVARTLVIAPLIGTAVAVLLEVPILLAASWVIARRLLRDRDLTLPQCIAVGTIAFVLTMASEAVLSEFTRDGKIEHRPGWDITLSAPKSVSIMAEVAGDKRLIAAHGAAAKVALAHVEKHMAATRVRDDGEVRREATGNLAIATFRHATSRAQDPQLHTHAVVINATQDRDGQWRSLEPRAFYQLQKEIGAIYRQELAHGIAELGYRIEPGKDAMFEIAGVPDKVIEALSQRTSAIDARLAERGTSRAEASRWNCAQATGCSLPATTARWDGSTGSAAP